MLLKPLVAALESVTAAAQAVADCDAKQAAAKSRLELCANLSSDDFEASRIATDTRTALDVCTSRRPFLVEELDRKSDALFAQLKKAQSLWAGELQEVTALELNQIAAALRPHFLGDERRLDETVRFMRAPSVLRIEQACFSPIEELRGQSLSLTARLFINHVQRHAKTLSIPIE